MSELLMPAIILIWTTKALSYCPHTLIHVGLSQNDKKLIIDAHNQMRQAVALGQTAGQPPAANMVELVICGGDFPKLTLCLQRWSDNLADGAQRWASTCVSFVHDPGRHTAEYLVGQNIATRWTTEIPNQAVDMHPNFVTDAISKWFNENSNYRFDNLLSLTTTHYTQMVWADTTGIGCGFAFYLDQKQRYTKKYVCNYGPSGNVEGEPPYQRGYPSCSNFGLLDSAAYVGLCETEKSLRPYAGNVVLEI